jgi:hypothetical protein
MLDRGLPPVISFMGRNSGMHNHLGGHQRDRRCRSRQDRKYSRRCCGQHDGRVGLSVGGILRGLEAPRSRRRDCGGALAPVSAAPSVALRTGGTTMEQARFSLCSPLQVQGRIVRHAGDRRSIGRISYAHDTNAQNGAQEWRLTSPVF